MLDSNTDIFCRIGDFCNVHHFPEPRRFKGRFAFTESHPMSRLPTQDRYQRHPRPSTGQRRQTEARRVDQLGQPLKTAFLQEGRQNH